MNEAQLKSLSKAQLISLAEQQEKEIERMNAELNRPRLDSGTSALLSEIMRAAQVAADDYVKKTRMAQSEKIDEIGRMESDAKRRSEETERLNAEALETTRVMLSDLNSVFNRQIEYIRSMQDQFHKMLCTTTLKDIFVQEQRNSSSDSPQPV